MYERELIAEGDGEIRFSRRLDTADVITQISELFQEGKQMRRTE